MNHWRACFKPNRLGKKTSHKANEKRSLGHNQPWSRDCFFIRQSFASNSLNRIFKSGAIFLFSCRVPIIKLRQVSRQVPFADMLVRPINRAFQLREISLCCVDVRVAADVFLFAVVYRFVFRKFFADLVVRCRSVCIQRGLLVHVLRQRLSNGFTVYITENLRPRITAALDNREYRRQCRVPE